METERAVWRSSLGARICSVHRLGRCACLTPFDICHGNSELRRGTDTHGQPVCSEAPGAQSRCSKDRSFAPLSCDVRFEKHHSTL